MTPARRRLAAIDVGTNTVRLLAVEAGRDSVEILDDFGEVTRLGREVATTGRIAPADADRTLACLQLCLERARAAGAGQIDVAGTEVFRAAANGAELARVYARRLGHPIRVLTPEQEAEASYLGVVGWEPDPVPEPLLVFDVGGGSTELIAGEGIALHQSVSLPVGALVITESFLRHDPPLEQELRGARAAIARAFSDIPGFRSRSDVLPHVVGVGGTFCALGAWTQLVVPYNPARVHGSLVTGEELAATAAAWSLMPLSERMAVGGLSEGRARVVLGGALVVQGLYAALGIRQARVSVHGLRHGLVLRRLLLA